MFSIKYRNQLLAFVLWIFAVIALFKFSSLFFIDKQVAALFTGAGFIVLPVLFLISELKNAKNKFYMVVLGLFLICSALPIFFLRIFNWGVEFSSLNLFGIPASFMHQYSNYFYILMLLSAAYRAIDEKKRAQALLDKK